MNQTYQNNPLASKALGLRLGLHVTDALNLFWGVPHLISVWNDRIRQRRDLAGLSAQMLDDLNLDRQQIRAELEKPFWRR